MNAITVNGLSKRYGKVVALDGVGFSVPPGKILGLLGPNGSGKTTTVAILSTSLLPDGGSANVGGHDVVLEAAAVRGLIGFAGQSAAVDANLTGRENLELIGRLSRVPRREVRQRVEELLHSFGLEDDAERLARTYSGGMRRRLDVAAALVHRPQVLFLDEPTTGLDPESRFGLWRLVQRLVSDGTTALLTTQYLEEADALADNVVILDHGRVIESGTPSDLKGRIGSALIDLKYSTKADATHAGQRLHSKGYTLEQFDTSVRVRSDDGSSAVV
jgi:ABC-type multidrug transport system ATPase subunit